MIPRHGAGEIAADEHLVPWALIAVVLATVGVAGSIWRPLAPSVEPIWTDLATFDGVVLAAVEQYRAPRLVVAILATVVSVAVPLAIPLTRRGRAGVARLAGRRPHSPLRAAGVAAAISIVISLALLPFAAWSRIVHDGQWQFRTQSAGSWFRDWLVVSVGRWLAVAVLAAILVAGMARWPVSWPYRLTVLGTVFAAVVVMIHPLVLQPVLLPTRPFPPGPHQAAITGILAAAGEPDLPLHVGDASRRSTRVNALVTGLGPTARVVVFDNLLELPPDQVAAVVAHELAHHEHRDLPRGVALAATVLLPSLLLLRMLMASPGVQRHVTARGPTDPRLVAVVLATVAVIELVGQPAANLVSRRLETAADVRAVELTGDPETLVRATRVFTIRDLATPEPPTWVTVLFRTHPSVADRIRLATTLAERQGMELPTREDLRADERGQRHPSIRDAAA